MKPLGGDLRLAAQRLEVAAIGPRVGRTAPPISEHPSTVRTLLPYLACHPLRQLGLAVGPQFVGDGDGEGKGALAGVGFRLGLHRHRPAPPQGAGPKRR